MCFAQGTQRVLHAEGSEPAFLACLWAPTAKKYFRHSFCAADHRFGVKFLACSRSSFPAARKRGRYV